MFSIYPCRLHSSWLATLDSDSRYILNRVSPNRVFEYLRIRVILPRPCLLNCFLDVFHVRCPSVSRLAFTSPQVYSFMLYKNVVYTLCWLQDMLLCLRNNIPFAKFKPLYYIKHKFHLIKRWNQWDGVFVLSFCANS